MTHTKGPWVVTDSYDDTTLIDHADKSQAYYAVCQVYRLLPEYESNARLIAAAPEMYEALKGMLDWARRVKGKNPGQEVFNAVAAIAHAEGR